MIYILKQRKFDPNGMGEVVEIVVRAASELHARVVASKSHGLEGPWCWLNESITSCEAIEPNGPPAVFCIDSLGY